MKQQPGLNFIETIVTSISMRQSVIAQYIPQSHRLSNKLLLASLLEQLPKRRKYSRISSSSWTILKTAWYLSQKIIKEANGDLQANKYQSLINKLSKPAEKLLELSRIKTKPSLSTNSNCTHSTQKSLSTRVFSHYF